MPVSTSARGRVAIIGREGFLLHSYSDSVDVWTIRVRHPGRAREPIVTPGMLITKVRADEILATDLAIIEAINEAVHVRLEQSEFDACVSLTFNIG